MTNSRASIKIHIPKCLKVLMARAIDDILGEMISSLETMTTRSMVKYRDIEGVEKMATMI